MQRRLGYLHNQKYHLVFLIQKDKYITEAQLKKKKKRNTDSSGMPTFPVGTFSLHKVARPQ